MWARCVNPLAALSLVAAACGEGGGGGGGGEPPARRDDGARAIEVDAGPSLQNPCFAGDTGRLLITRWTGGYNASPAVVATVLVEGGELRVLTDPDATSVNLPGSCYSAATGRVVYSSDAGGDHDEIFSQPLRGGPAEPITGRSDAMAFEPSLSPDGAWVAFESHPLDVEGEGAIFKVRADGSELVQLTDGSGDDRQPSWSPAGDVIVFQSHERVPGNVEIFAMDPDGGSIRNVTGSPSEDTDASFSPDGARIVYSSDEGGLDLASLFVRSLAGGPAERITFGDFYDGAPAWSPDGSVIAFESRASDPDGSEGTVLYAIDAP